MNFTIVFISLLVNLTKYVHTKMCNAGMKENHESI
jgi:hypothetical protein